MSLVRHDTAKREIQSPRRLEFFDRFFDDLPEVFRRPVLLWPERGFDPFGVEEFTEGGELVVRVELAGIDPDKDVDISIEDGMLHVAAERREETQKQDRDYVRRELRYGSFHRDLPLPKGTSDTQVTATYTDGILEIRVPLPESGAAAPVKVSVTKR